jgi:hypothetical protein
LVRFRNVFAKEEFEDTKGVIRIRQSLLLYKLYLIGMKK